MLDILELTFVGEAVGLALALGPERPDLPSARGHSGDQRHDDCAREGEDGRRLVRLGRARYGGPTGDHDHEGGDQAAAVPAVAPAHAPSTSTSTSMRPVMTR